MSPQPESRVPSLQDRAPHPVRDPRLQLLEAADAAQALAGGEADPLAALQQCLVELRNEGRIVLAVAVERHDDGRAGGAHAAAHGGALAAADLVA